MTTQKQRVLARLAATNGGWLCSRVLLDPRVCGSRAAARIHDLRCDGLLIESGVCGCSVCLRFRPTRVAAYRLLDLAETELGGAA